MIVMPALRAREGRVLDRSEFILGSLLTRQP
jgi:hypothetical protein